MATATTKQDLSHLRSLLTPGGSPRVKDPDMVDKEKDNTPAIATPTKGPHRMTFVVPHDDESVVNIGKADPGTNRINETGITGKTKSHVHWHTTEEPETILSLGLGAPSLKIHSSKGDGLIKEMKGVGLFTEAQVWQDSKEKFTMISRTEDISMRTMGAGEKKGEPGKVASMQSDTGMALVWGGNNSTVASPNGVVIGADPTLTLQDVQHEESWTDKWRRDLYAKVGQTINLIGELGTAGLAIAHSMSTTKTVGQEGKTGEGTRKRIGSKAKLVADLGLFVAAIVHGFDEVKGAEPPGTTAIHGQKNASMTAGEAAAVYGQVSASLSSLATASVLGGVSAVLKGLMWTEVASGLGTGITSIKDVEIAAEKGKLEVAAKTEAVIAVEDGPIVITAAKKIVQINCNDGHAVVHGSKGAFIGAGPGAGFGMEFEPSGLKLGKASAAGSNFEKPGIDPKASMAIEADKIEIVLQQSTIEMKAAETKVAVGSTSIEWTPAQLKVEASMIMLG